MKTLKLKLVLVCILIVTSISAQKTLNKISKSINVDKNVTIDLNTSYVQLEVDTWNKNVLEIEAYIEGEKLSKDDLKKALKNWDITVEGSGNLVKIYSKGTRGSWNDDYSDSYSDVLKDLEFRLADLPELPKMPEMASFPEMPVMPAIPEFPELPELPEGVNSISFDYDTYKKDGEKYLDKWSKEYEAKYGKEYKESMKEWARKFGDSDYQKKMEKWGEELGKKFEGKWSKDMEDWGENFGKQFGSEWEEKMEKWGERFGKEMEERSKLIEERSEELEKRMVEREKSMEERRGRLEERKENRVKGMKESHKKLRKTHFNSENNNKVKKTIKIKMPKNAKLNMNVRHGELKFSSVIHNLKAKLSHSNLEALSIDGPNTSINASYASILVDNWKNGGLDLNYVENALLKSVNALRLNANASNINIDNLAGNSVINGSFGELTIHNILDTFNNLNIVLENSEALVKLPQTSYNLQYNGNKSHLSHPEKKDSDNSSSFSTGNLNSNKTIVVNAKYSTVVMQ